MNAATPAQKPNIQQLNMAARQAILMSALEMTQKIFSTTQANPGSTNNVFNIAPRYVGLAKRFTVMVTATITNTSTATALTRTAYNAANLLSQIVFNDLNNYTRIQTTGWHLNLVNSIRTRHPFGAAMTSDAISGFGSNFNATLFAAPSTIAAATTGVLYFAYEVPLAYSDEDLSGALYLGLVNSTALLQLTVNPNAVVATGDAVQAVYSGAAGSITSVSLNVYQTYLDQLPVGKNGPVLPVVDLSTIYELKNTQVQNMTVGQDFPIPYSNFRNFLSTFAIFDNNGTLNAGSDVNYWALQSANFTNIWKLDPNTQALQQRKELWDDFPLGTYYFSHRRKPINTVQYGNIELILNPATVNAGAQILLGYEDFAYQNTVTGAGSLAGGGGA